MPYAERLNRTWYGMHQRCYNPKVDRFPHYGGRGISVCLDWHDYSQFKLWAESNGYTDDLCIDRINVDLGYTPDNCQWITKEENHLKMMEDNLERGTGIFSPSAQNKSKESLRDRLGKKTYCSKDGIELAFNSRGEVADYLSDILGRKRGSVKSHVTLCLSGRSQSIGGWKIYEREDAVPS